MSSLIRGFLIVTALVAVAPQAEAQLFRRLFNDCCVSCQQPMCNCTCSTIEPIVETCYRQEKCVNWRDVQCTASRTEAFCETVPVQRQHNVCVDEGCWKMVWCPKPVTKTICTTEYQQRVNYRQVPYTYTKKVPEVTTRVVPQQTVRYVEKRTVTYTRPISGPTPICEPVCPPAACPPAACPPEPCPQPMIGPQPTFAPQSTNFTPPSCATPGTAMTPNSTTMVRPAQPQMMTASSAYAPQSQGQPSNIDQWTLVPSRPQPTAQPQPSNMPAPSAATVWQNRPMVRPF